MVKHGAAAKKSVDVTYVGRGMGRIVLRRFDPERDSFDELTAMLHRAFARLGAMGLNCTCTDQPVSVTKARATRGDCYVVVCDGRLIGTVTLHAPDRYSPCELYRNADIASMRQFGVDPAWQTRGIGTLLLAFADHWAATRGYAELALDTPQPATHLLAFYRSHGFRIADFMRFDGKRYDSAILRKPAIAARTLATWSRRLELPRYAVACVA
ncbi:GNAT family N-acetyltransferase [Paraburkholderia sp. 40]|uniref:GNAT family N-acetyltransferase n=1 Tax=Paraburkholderia sp. 40 TaxID=2991059 RepID=UPI003D1FC34F